MSIQTPSIPDPHAASRRRTIVILSGWLAATLLAGVPAGAGSSASAQTRKAATPKIVHSGPECLAGHTVPPSKKRR